MADIIDKRRTNTKLYNRELRNLDKEYFYPWEKGAVPWRFNVFAPLEIKHKLIETFLIYNLPISDWYPVVTPIFDISQKDYINAKKMEDSILNFPLIINETDIIQICGIVTSILLKRGLS